MITPDGNRIAFLSAATDLVAGVTNGPSQVFLRDLTTDLTRLVGASTSDTPNAVDIELTLPAISADGHRVVSESEGVDLVPDDANFAIDVFVCDLDSNVTELVSKRHPASVRTCSRATNRVGRSCRAGKRAAQVQVKRWLTGDGCATGPERSRGSRKARSHCVSPNSSLTVGVRFIPLPARTFLNIEHENIDQYGCQNCD